MADIITWPWPRMIITKWRTLLCYNISTSLFLGELSVPSVGGLALTPVLNLGFAADITQVDVADFGPFYVVCTLGPLGVQTFYRNISVPNVINTGNFALLSIPACGVACNFKQQFIGANIVSPNDTHWGQLGSRGIVWSGVGEFELDPGVNLMAGNSSIFSSNTLGQTINIYKLLQLGDRVVVYSDAGKVSISPQTVGSTFTYGAEELPGYGVRSGNHVCGSDDVHGFIDLNSDLWILLANGQQTLLGYREFIAPLIAAPPVIMSYLARDRRFYISNATTCLVVSQNGAYTTHQRVSSVSQAWNGTLYGTFSDSGDRTGLVVPDALDFRSRGLKSLESILAELSCDDDTTVDFSTDWRLSKNSAYTRLGFRPGGPTAEARIGVSALEFRPCVRFSEYVDSELTSLLLNVKFTDQRYKRGTVPAQYSA